VVTLDQLMDTDRLDRINREAREVHFGRVLLTVIAAVLFGVGWIVAKTFTVVWLGCAWSATAVRIGFEAGRAGRTARP
jgi:hypothetical protein